MNKIFYFTTMLILVFFSACTPNRVVLFPHDLIDGNESTKSWNALLIEPKEFPEQTLLAPITISPFLYQFQKTNPGFVDLDRFKHNLPDHPLSELKRWYSAYFFQKNSYLSYMVFEFADAAQAQKYLSRLRTEEKNAALKILRYKHYLISIQVRDNTNKLQKKEESGALFLWAADKQSKIMSEL